MPSLLDALQGFNRRERHILVGWVLDRLTFPLGHEFRDALSRAIGVPVPADAYVAMDYNLNWLCVALMWSQGQVDKGIVRPYDPMDGVELDDNSDSDLVVAFACGPSTHVVLLEAKGFMRFGSVQMTRKCSRLKAIFGESGDRFADVVPYWVFVSPKVPQLQKPAQWMINPDSGSPRHIVLPQPASHKFAIKRCDALGKRMDGSYWTIRSAPWPGPILVSPSLDSAT